MHLSVSNFNILLFISNYKFFNRSIREFSSAVRKKSGDLCTARDITSLSLADRRDRRDTLDKWWLPRNPNRSRWHHNLYVSCFNVSFYIYCCKVGTVSRMLNHSEYGIWRYFLEWIASRPTSKTHNASGTLKYSKVHSGLPAVSPKSKMRGFVENRK